MRYSCQHCKFIFDLKRLPTTLACALAFFVALPIAAQTFTVIHNFSGGQDGSQPVAGLTIDKAGNFYGTASAGGAGYGTVFKLTHKNSGWTFNPLYSFTGGNEGASPKAPVALGANGTLYGTTAGGGNDGFGTVYNLKPSAVACKSALCPWRETVLYGFRGLPDGAYPESGVVFDQAGNIYGTTQNGGTGDCDIYHLLGCGIVYELTASGGGWTENVLYSFQQNVGAWPDGRIVFDKAGNLYGVCVFCGPIFCESGIGVGGSVYELSPSGSGWTAQALYGFTDGSDGGFPRGGLIFDASGNLYGTTEGNGSGGGGTVFELMAASGSWAFSTIYSFSGSLAGPLDNLAMDAAGNLYGTTYGDGIYRYGSVFKLTPSNGSWTYSSLHDFTGGSDGAFPYSDVVFDGDGNLYGTASEGGNLNCGAPGGCGVVWKITP